jgi:hypothetical protein
MWRFESLLPVANLECSGEYGQPKLKMNKIDRTSENLPQETFPERSMIVP